MMCDASTRLFLCAARDCSLLRPMALDRANVIVCGFSLEDRVVEGIDTFSALLLRRL